ncbi:hypothetical protein B4114_1465 [Geobacillus stearothermophilus]|uniref:Uncharacterized protein n=1 Tax=Geobacillus stearothermophilus TaxID=1422 RepID=A0A150N5X3_GEOSE|nr:hypothetical protein B4114_1465 [Geobacillus stearothermophilus]
MRSFLCISPHTKFLPFFQPPIVLNRCQQSVTKNLYIQPDFILSCIYKFVNGFWIKNEQFRQELYICFLTFTSFVMFCQAAGKSTTE